MLKKYNRYMGIKENSMDSCLRRNDSMIEENYNKEKTEASHAKEV